jgi:hypothetical protein
MTSPLPQLSVYARRLSQWSLHELCASFPGLKEAFTRLDFTFRERVFSPVVTFCLFLSQVLSDGASCQEVVANALAALWLTESKQASPENSAYCQARKRLPEAFLQQVAEQTAGQIESQVRSEQLWMGRRVKIVDGSSLSMPDTPANQKLYPQPTGQKPGCGFPVMRLVVVFSLATGTILRIARGTLWQSERLLFRSLQGILQAGDVLLADRGFCGYADIYILIAAGVDAVVRLHRNRSTGARCMKRLGSGDRLVEWRQSSKKRPAWIELNAWIEIPKSLTLREITYTVSVKGFRSESVTLATTLTDPKRFTKNALVDLYFRRWNAELHLRDIKISLHMDVLRCKTPEMIHKELWMHIIAYNLIRTLMWQAAQHHQVCAASLSFKGCLASIRQWAPWIATLNPGSRRFLMTQQLLLKYLAQLILPHRPNRVEPRARKRRPKNYPLLTKPRNIFKDIPHRNRYHA